MTTAPALPKSAFPAPVIHDFTGIGRHDIGFREATGYVDGQFHSAVVWYPWERVEVGHMIRWGDDILTARTYWVTRRQYGPIPWINNSGFVAIIELAHIPVTVSGVTYSHQ